MKCTLCGYEFNEKEAEMACKNCPMMKGCRLVKCPNCGMDSPPEPKWIKCFKKREDRYGKIKSEPDRKDNPY